MPERYADCSAFESNHPPLFAEPFVAQEVVDRERVSFNAIGTQSGVYKLCYAYSSNPTVFVPYFEVKMVFQGVLDITTNEGGNYFLVVGHPKTITVQGTNLQYAGDKVSLTKGMNCDEENLVALNKNGDKVMVLNEQGQTVLETQETSATAADGDERGGHVPLLRHVLHLREQPRHGADEPVLLRVGGRDGGDADRHPGC